MGKRYFKAVFLNFDHVDEEIFAISGILRMQRKSFPRFKLPCIFPKTYRANIIFRTNTEKSKKSGCFKNFLCDIEHFFISHFDNIGCALDVKSAKVTFKFRI